MSKIKLYIKQMIILSVGNKLRFFLMLIGMFAGIIILSTGNLLLQSYYYSKFKEIREMPRDVSYFYCESLAEGEKVDVNLDENQAELMKISFTSNTIYLKEDRQGNEVRVIATITGISDVCNRVVIDVDGDVRPIGVSIKYGRNINENEIRDNAKVCLIDEYTANILFGKSECVGEKIKLGDENGSGIYVTDGEDEGLHNIEKYEIVGVMKNSYYSDKQNINMKENPLDEDSVNVKTIFVPVICPYYYNKHLGTIMDKPKYNVYMWLHTSESEKKSKNNVEKDRVRYLKEKMQVSELYDKDYFEEILQDELEPIRYGINILTVALMIVAGVSYMSILFFGLKERVNEIGIRKAFGATSIDIVFQFVLENIVVTMAAVILAVFTSITIGKISESFFVENILKDYELHISLQSITLPVFAGLIQCLIFTMIPSIYFSLIRVTSALRHE